MCGIVAVINKEREAVSDLYIALLQMQHRGKESAGIVVFHQETMMYTGGMGEVAQVFSSKQLNMHKGTVGIGHVRYGTHGSGGSCNIQPLKGVFRGSHFYLAHNGNLTNVDELKKIVSTKGDVSDTRVIADLLSLSSAPTFEDALRETLPKLRGAFNLIFLIDGCIYAVKDSFGFHPLQLGRRGDDFLVASESCVFDHLGAELVYDIKPGHILVVDTHGYTSHRWATQQKLTFDIFEFIYFLRPDSVTYGVEAGMARYWMGNFLAQEHPMDIDMVIPIADSGNEAAQGYYEGLPQKGHVKFRPWALFRPHTVSRTFIEPAQETRQHNLNLKFNPRPTLIKGKHVMLVDDSLVRGNTMTKVVGLMYDAGAEKVSAVIASPMYRYPDFYGIDTGRAHHELIAHRQQGNIDAIREKCGLDYLGYLPLDLTIKAVLKAGEDTDSELSKDSFYTGPFSGIYPAGKG